MLLGFVDNNFNYRVFNLDTNRISISHNVFFQEDVFPFKRIVPPPVVVEEEERIEPHVTVQAPSTHDPHPTDDDELLGVPQSELRSSTETIPPGQLATPHSPPIEEFPPPQYRPRQKQLIFLDNRHANVYSLHDSNLEITPSLFHPVG